MKISIVTVTRNDGQCLERALQSVGMQIYPDVEHIVVDGNDAPEAVRKSTSRVKTVEDLKVLRHEPHGVYEALNFGFANATGDVIGLVHGNDALASARSLQYVADAFEVDPKLDFIYGDMLYVHKNYAPFRVYHADNFDPRQLLGGMAPPHPTMFMRREVFERVGDYALDLPNAADFEMWIRLFNDRTLHYRYVPKVLANMTTGGRSARLSARLFTNNAEKIKALRRNNLPANYFRLLQKYVLILRDIIFSPNHND